MVFKVTHVIDCNTYEVSPPWKWDSQAGIRVRAAGYSPPGENEYGFKNLLDRLTKYISGKEVELKNFREIDYDCLVCDVFVDGRNLADYFSE
jgi:hypothetical protein